MEYPVRPWRGGGFDFDDLAWREGAEGTVDQYRPESSDHRPRVTFQLFHTSEGLLGRFDVQDQYVSCRRTQLNDMVCKDSCVEFFVQAGGTGPYINFEWNACGVLHASHVLRPREEFTLFTEEEAASVSVRTSLKEQPPLDIPEPLNWSLVFHIPYMLLGCRPGVGDSWQANFYKCGDDTSHPHWGAWSPVPRLDFHDPDSFGTLVFKG